MIEDGMITKIGKEPQLPQADKSLNLNGQLVIPGIIDAHVHLRDFQLAYKETFLSGTRAAAMGGVTTVLDMPNTKPPTINSILLQEKKQKVQNNIFTNVGFFSGLPESIEEIENIVREKPVGFKIYPHLLRHSMAHQFLKDNNNDIVGLAQILGHENINTTARYTQRTEKQIGEAVERLEY